MKNKNGVRYLDLISSVFSVKDCKVQEGREGTGHGGIYETGRQTDRERKRERKRKRQKERRERVFFIIVTVRLMGRGRNFGVPHEPLGRGEKAA